MRVQAYLCMSRSNTRNNEVIRRLLFSSPCFSKEKQVFQGVPQYADDGYLVIVEVAYEEQHRNAPLIVDKTCGVRDISTYWNLHVIIGAQYPMSGCRPPLLLSLNEAFAGRRFKDVGSNKGIMRAPPWIFPGSLVDLHGSAGIYL